MMDNWYFIYDASGFSKEEIKDLSKCLEKLGYKYHKCTGLGAGPSVEQIIVWIHNNQFVSGVSIGVLTNFIYDILKNLYLWFKSHNHEKKNIPSAEFFLNSQDLENKKISAKLKFRIDKLYDKKYLSKSIRFQTKLLRNMSQKNNKYSVYKKIVHHHVGYFLKKVKHKINWLII